VGDEVRIPGSVGQRLVYLDLAIGSTHVAYLEQVCETPDVPG
jgi:hypothetical protein